MMGSTRARYELASIGAGNMAEGIVAAVVEKGLYPPEAIVVSDPVEERRELFARRFGVATTTDNLWLVAESRRVILSVKPQGFDEVAAGVAGAVRADHLFISIMAGKSTADIAAALCCGREGIPGEEGARKDSRTSGTGEARKDSRAGGAGGCVREGIPAEEGARKDSRTSGAEEARQDSRAGGAGGCVREGIPAGEGARKDSRTSGAEEARKDSRTSGSGGISGMGEVHVVRVMPNLPIRVGAGMAGICKGAGANERDVAEVQAIFNAGGGSVVLADESLMDAVTAMSGSGPAYFYFFVEAMVEGGKACGLSESDALELAKFTCLGAGRMMLETGEPPAELRAKVTSKGGTTQAALEALRQAGVDCSIRDAVIAAFRRGRELGG